MVDGENKGQAMDVPATIRVLMPNGQVSQMQLETYLAGAVAVEIGTNAPLEALKAQAVASRTYAFSMHRHSEAGADVCTTAHCQAWRRVDPIVAPEVFRAISETWGMIATFDQKPIEAFFFEHCDGHTRNSEDLLMAPLPYLRRVDCGCGFVSLKGHGVGLCQRGAIVMARQGASFEEILRHYYKDIRIVQIGRQQAEAAAAAQPARDENGPPSTQAELARPATKGAGATKPVIDSFQPAPPSSTVALAPAEEIVVPPASSSAPAESLPVVSEQADAQSVPLVDVAAVSQEEPAAPEPVPGNGHQAEGGQAGLPIEVAPSEPEAVALDAQEAERTDGVRPLPTAELLQQRMPAETTGLVDTVPASTQEPVQFLLPPLPSGELPAVPATPTAEPELALALGVEAEHASGAEPDQESLAETEQESLAEPEQEFLAEPEQESPAESEQESPAEFELVVESEPEPAAQKDSASSSIAAPPEMILRDEPSVETYLLPPADPELGFGAEVEPPPARPRVHVDHLPGARIIGGCLGEPGIMVKVRDEKGSETLIYSGSAPQYGKGGFETVVDADGRYFVSIEQEMIEVFVRGDTVFIQMNE